MQNCKHTDTATILSKEISQKIVPPHSETMDFGYGDPEAASDEVQEADVILIDGTVKKNYPILLFNTVHEEKVRIWRSETRSGPPDVNDLVLLLITSNGHQKPMEDNKDFGYYCKELADSQIKFVHRREIAGRQANPQAFNANVRE